MIGIIDYGMGNIASVYNALVALGLETKFLKHPHEISQAHKLILPGVGAFPDGMARLKETGWQDSLTEAVKVKGMPLLGICLGMQLLFEEGTEYGVCPGLGWIPGKVVHLKELGCSNQIPHVGWNDITIQKENVLFQSIEDSSDFYFVHSYACVPKNPSIVSSSCDYGVSFTSSISSQNIHATQFHPEKSQKGGLKLLENFAKC